MISNYENKTPKPFARTREFQRYTMLDSMFNFMDAFKRRYPRELTRLQVAIRAYLASPSSSNVNEPELLNEYMLALQSCVQLDRLSSLMPESIAVNIYQHAEQLPHHIAASRGASSREFVIPDSLIQSLKDKVEGLDKALINGPGTISQRAGTDLTNFFNQHLGKFLKAPPGDIRQVCAKGYIMLALSGILSYASVAHSSSRQAVDYLRWAHHL